MARVPSSSTGPTRQPTRQRRFGRKNRKPKREGPSAFAQIRETYKIARRHDHLVLVWPAVAILVTIGIGVGVGFGIGSLLIPTIVAAILSLPVALRVFLGRARPAIYTEAKDRPGIAIHEVRQMRGDWKITEAVQFNRNQEFVHRVIGKPGVILIAEGRSRNVRDLLSSEARRTRRIAPDSPVHEILVGDREDEGQIPLVKLRRHMMRLPRTLRPADVKALDVKLKAVVNTSMPIPKGPIPTRMPRKLR